MTQQTRDDLHFPARQAGTLHSEAKIAPLSPAIGADIRGVDLTRELDETTFLRVREAWYAHNILLFTGQRLSLANQVRFAARFGELATIHNKRGNPGVTEHPSVMYISNVRQDGRLIGALPDGEMFFHSDQCYLERPCMATMLYAMDIPSRGGDTLFANMYAAYDTLPDDLKRRIQDRMAMNVYDYGNNPTQRPTADLDNVPAYPHPMVNMHPVTGRPALFVNRLMTTHIVDMPRKESDKILAFLFDHQEQSRFVYTHVWTPGDLILWDNRCTLHARTDFDASERRRLRRVIIQHERTE